MKTFNFLFLFLGTFLFGQNISGIVKSEKSTPIANVNIYIDGTKNSTTTNHSGVFTLDLKGVQSGNIVFQKEGFEQKIIPINTIKNTNFNIILAQYQEIEELVIVPYTEQTYQKYIQYFLNQFIGNDQKNVKIKNQRTLKFSYDKTNKILRVKAPKTLIIENKNLGYILHYNLINFTSDFQNNTVSYYGTSFYKEASDKPKVKLNRANAYLGSPQHFFRSVYQNRVEEEGFWVNYIIKIPNPKHPTEAEKQKLAAFRDFHKNSRNITIPADISDIIKRMRESEFALALTKSKIPIEEYLKTSDDKKIFTAKDILQVNFNKIPYQLKKGKLEKTEYQHLKTSKLYVENQQFEVFSTGDISNPEQLITDGDFSENRIETLLPSDYILGE